MSNHPNRSKKTPSEARNPRPEEIVAAREAAGLTQTEAGELIYSALRSWQDWESGERRMHPAFWDLWRRKVRERVGPTRPRDWFEEKAHQIEPAEGWAFGISFNSRYNRASELREIFEFAALAAEAGLERYVKAIFYDSKACLCTFELAPEVQPGDPIEEGLRSCAKRSIRQFDWFGGIQHRAGEEV